MSHAVQVTQDGKVMVENSDMVENSEKTLSTGEGNGKPLQHSCHKNSMNSMKGQKDMMPEDKPPKLEDVQYVAGQVQFSHSVMSNSLRPHGLQHARLPCPSPTPGAC